MEISKLKSCLLVVLLVAGFLFITTKPASADTYQKFLLASEGEVEFYGMDDSGSMIVGRRALRPPGGHVFHGVCNNGRDAFTGLLSSSQVIADVYVGSYPNISLVASGGYGFIYMNDLGDFVYDDEISENWYFLLDTTTSTVPEPGSILLLGTAALAVIVAIHWRSRELVD